jgi:zinc metalloprotease ZmpB
MKSRYDPNLKAHLTLDDNEKVRQIRHSQEYFLSEHNNPRLAADDYLNKMAEPLRISKEELKNVNKKVSFLDPREQGIEYHLSEEKHLFDSITIGYYQTYNNVPVWRSGISVKIKQNPNRVVGSTNNSENDIHGKLPDTKTIDPYKKVFRQAAARKAAIDAGLSEEEHEDETASFVRKLINVKAPSTTRKIKRANVPRAHDETRMLSGKFFMYKYDPKRRYAGRPSSLHENKTKKISEEEQEIPFLKLPAVSDKIKSGESYLIAEIIFTSNAAGFNGLVWLILVEVETGSILYIECMTCGVNGKVFRLDPIVKTGDLSITSDDDNMALNPHQDDEPLTNLDGPVAGTQHLRGTFVDVEELTISHADPDVAPATQPSGINFYYNARTNNFGAVNAYYHQTELFKTIEDLGFPIIGAASYFDGTTFPIPIDHRALGDVINAHWSPNGTDGTAHMCYALCDTTNTVEPLLRAVDRWVHWHEMGGHGTLGDHVGSGNLGFSHSAGDGLAAIQMDPESALRAMPERFRYAPFRPTAERRFDRDVAAWAWGGPVVGTPCGTTFVSGDDGCYGSEQILATCHFRIYRSIGGDHDNLARRKFASRMVTYLILRTIGNLTPMTNPSNWDPVTMTNVPGRGAQLWCEEMQDTDLENWTSEGLSGGAYNKVIRWAFEKQGSYQPAGAPTPVTTVGSPPEVDVYIDDGRSGEYQFQAIHWENMSIWNRNAPDGASGHQNAIEGVTNYIYGKVKNRGTSAVTKVTVRSYHCLPGAGLIWPDDFTEMNPVGGLPIPSIGANNTQEVTVGPFEWVPNVNTYGHDCVLMIASASGDPSNIDNFTGTETIAEWRLVPNDNNIGQRNVSIVPGGGGSEALIAALDGAVFFAGNSFNRPAKMELRANMPRVLASKGWSLEFADLDDNKFRLKAGEKRNVRLKLSKGNEFTADEIKTAEERSIRVYLYGNDLMLGGMTYQIDPDLKEPSGGKRLPGIEFRGVAHKLLDSLKIPIEKKVKNVRVKNIAVDIELDSDAD